jgi:hypothetical protein
MLDRRAVIGFVPLMVDAEKVYEGIPGGLDLVTWFGHVPGFHDAEIVSLMLNRGAPSAINIHAWNTTQQTDERGFLVLEKHAVVTFVFEDIIDLHLDGFSCQNVIFGLQLRVVAEHPDRGALDGRDAPPSIYEMELEPCFGLSGIIRCRKISVQVVPGKIDNEQK